MKTKLLLLTALLITQFSFAQWEEVGTPLVGEFIPAFFGESVAISGDGNYLAVGQPSRGTSSTSTFPSPVVIYERDGEDWNEIHRIEAPLNPDERYGQSLDFTPDGRILVIGASVLDFDVVQNIGRAQVFERQSDDSFDQIGDDIINPGQGAFFGEAVSISADGTTIAVGRPLITPGLNEGEVSMFRFDGSGWEQLGQSLGGDPATDIFFGEDVSLNSDGTLVAIGIQRADEINFTGAMEIYEYTDGTDTWTLIGNRIIGDDGSFLGDSVEMTPDGSTIVVGANRNNEPGPPPYVEVYQRSGNEYVLKGNRISSELGFSGYGDAVSISDDGAIIAFGAPLVGPNDSIDEEGAIKIYEFESDDWVLKNALYGEVLFENLGEAIAMSADGGVIVAGAINYDPNGQQGSQGGVRTFQNSEILSVENSTFTTAISAFPNPVQNTVTIDLGDNQTAIDIRVFDASGREVLQQSFENQQRVQVQMNQLTAGVYLARLTNAKGNVAAIRLVRQ